MKKLFYTLTLILAACFILCLTFGCGETTSNHEHTFSSVWSKSEETHWHAATCEHNVIANKAEHSWDLTYTQPATETQEGVSIYTCNVCGATKTEEIPKIEKLTSSFNISFDLNGGTSAHETTSLNVEALNIEDFFFDVTKDGYCFRGWSCEGIKVFDEQGNALNEITLKPNMLFVAEYSNTANIAITTNIPEAGDYSKGGEYTCNSEVQLIATPYEEYEFAAWMCNNAILSTQPEYTYIIGNQDVALVAVFKYPNRNLYIHSYDASKGLVFIEPTGLNDQYGYEKHSAIPYKAETTIAACSLTDTRFLGWFDQNNVLVSSNAVYSFTMPNSDYSLTAKWDYFIISYYLDGGTNDSRNPTWYSSDMPDIPLYDPTMEDYSFHDWRNDNNEPITSINTKLCANITVYATWPILNSYPFRNNTTVAIGDWVTTIGNGVFKNRYALTSITIPDSVTSIGDSAFSGCSGLTSATIGNSVTYIGNSAFYSCSGLTSATIGNSVTYIGNEAFRGCSDLTSITIPDSVTNIGNHAFSDCSGLTSIDFQGTKEKWNAIHKGSEWAYYSSIYIIHCTDGDIL